MKTLKAVMIALTLLSLNALADGFEFPIKEKPIEGIEKPIPFPGTPVRGPIKVCEKSPDPEMTHSVKGALQQAAQKVQCGSYEEALELMEMAYEGIDYLQGQAARARGYCYSNLNCRRPLVAPRLVTEKQCKATGIGMSWQQQTPRVAPCTSPL